MSQHHARLLIPPSAVLDVVLPSSTCLHRPSPQATFATLHRFKLPSSPSTALRRLLKLLPPYAAGTILRHLRPPSHVTALGPFADGDLHSQPMKLFPSAELFSSDEDNCIAKSKSPKKYFSFESSNPTTDTNPSSLPPVMHSFLQLNIEPQNSKHEIISITKDCNAAANGSASHMSSVPLDFFKDSNGQSKNGGQSQNVVVQNIPYPAGCSSSSRLDHSPSTSNSYAEELTSRIIFKLFDKDPSLFPVNLRAEILSWLSSRPLEMESYIRPRCVVLSIYLCMLHKDWDELDKDSLKRVFSLINHSKSGF